MVIAVLGLTVGDLALAKLQFSDDNGIRCCDGLNTKGKAYGCVPGRCRNKGIVIHNKKEKLLRDRDQNKSDRR